MDLSWDVIALLLCLAFSLGFCIGKMWTESGGNARQVRDLKGVSVQNIHMSSPEIPSRGLKEHLGTEPAVDLSWELCETDVSTVFRMSKAGKKLHMKDPCPGLNGRNHDEPMRDVILCGHCKNWANNMKKMKLKSEAKTKES